MSNKGVKMTKNNRPQITTRLSDKKWILAAGATVLFFVIVLVLLIIFGGSWAADPWGKQPGPGP